jgi:hypothetical protein
MTVPILNKPHPFQRLEAEHTYLPCTSCRQQKEISCIKHVPSSSSETIKLDELKPEVD